MRCAGNAGIKCPIRVEVRWIRWATKDSSAGGRSELGKHQSCPFFVCLSVDNVLEMPNRCEMSREEKGCHSAGSAVTVGEVRDLRSDREAFNKWALSVSSTYRKYRFLRNGGGLKSFCRWSDVESRAVQYGSGGNWGMEVLKSTNQWPHWSIWRGYRCWVQRIEVYLPACSKTSQLILWLDMTWRFQISRIYFYTQGREKIN